MKELPVIYHQTQWLTSLRKGDVAVGRMLTNYADLSFSVLLSRFNARHGQERDIYIHYHFNRETLVMVLVCVSWEEHLQEFKNKKYEEAWRERIPKDYG